MSYEGRKLCKFCYQSRLSIPKLLTHASTPTVSALCVLHAGISESAPTEETLQKLVASLLPKHCIPAMVLFSEAELPRNATGKILKADVKKHCAGEWERRQAKKTKAKL